MNHIQTINWLTTHEESFAWINESGKNCCNIVSTVDNCLALIATQNDSNSVVVAAGNACLMTGVTIAFNCYNHLKYQTNGNQSM